MSEPVNVFQMSGLTVDAIRKPDGKIELKGKGIFKFAVDPFLTVVNKQLAVEKPAKVTNDAVYPSSWLPPIPSPAFRRLINAEVGISYKKFIPETVSIEVTRKHNENARKYSKAVKSGNFSDPPESQIKNAIDQALDAGAVVITFTEGDPMLNENIVEYVRYVDKERAVVMAYTWGLDFTPEKAKRLKEAGLQTLLVSIYSTDPAVHDAKRGIPGAYGKAMNAIKVGLDAGLLVTMATHLDEKRMDEMEKILKLAEKAGVHEFSIWESVPTLEGKRMMTDSHRKRINDFYKIVNSSSGNEPRIFSSTIFEGEMFGAMAGRRWLHITTDGEVWPDPYVPLSYGNINDEPLSEIWKRMRKEPAFREKRNSHVLYDPSYLKKVRDANDWDFRDQK